jgi:hypothetical protein
MSYRAGFIYLFESEEMPGWYYMKEDDKVGGDDYFHRFNRTGKWDETNLDANAKKAGGYGMPRIKVKYPVSVEMRPHDKCWRFAMYIDEEKAAEKKIIRDEQNANNIWYKFKEPVDLEKWGNEFVNIRKKQMEETAIKENTGRQISLF